MSIKSILEAYREQAASGDAGAHTETISGATSQDDCFRNIAVFGNHELIIDEPKEFGGADTAANPAEVLLGAVGASIGVTLRGHAELMDIDLRNITVKLDGMLDARGFFDLSPDGGAGFQNIDVYIDIESDAPEQALDELFARVRRCCPMLAACENPTSITWNAQVQTKASNL